MIRRPPRSTQSRSSAASDVYKRAGGRCGLSGRNATELQRSITMSTGLMVGIIVVVALAVILFALAIRIVQQYEKGVLFRFGRVIGEKAPGFVVIIPLVNSLRKVSFRVVTMPIQSQGIITRDNVSVDVSAVSYYRVVDATKSVIAIENVKEAINQIAQTTLRKDVGQHTLDEMLAETDRINVVIKEILDVQTADLSLIHISEP